MSGRLKEHRALLTTIVLYESKEVAHRGHVPGFIIVQLSRMQKGRESRWTYHLGMLRWIQLLKVLLSFMLSSVLLVIYTKLLCKMARLKLHVERIYKFLIWHTTHTHIYTHTHMYKTHSRFSVLFSYHKANTLQLPVIESLLDSISKLPLDSNLSDNAERTLLSNLFDELQSLLTMTLNVLNNHLIDFNAKSPSSMGSLKEHLMYVCIMFPVSISHYVFPLPQDSKETVFNGYIREQSAILPSVNHWCC